jgi:hypothetical protein
METLDRTLVVEADGHVDEGNVDLTSRLPERWRSQAPVRVKDNEGNPRLLLEGRIWGAGSAGPHPSVSGPMTDKARKGRPGMIDPLARLGDMDLEGIDVAVLFGMQIALTVNGLMNGELAAALCHAVNEWLLQYCSADPRRLRAVGLIPCQARAAAVKELEAGSERFFKYLYVHMTAFPFEQLPRLGAGHLRRPRSQPGAEGASSRSERRRVLPSRQSPRAARSGPGPRALAERTRHPVRRRARGGPGLSAASAYGSAATVTRRPRRPLR